MEDERKEITEVTIFGKKYKTEDLTMRVKQGFINNQRMDADFNEKQYQSLVALSAMKHYQEQLMAWIEEDKLKPIKTDKDTIEEADVSEV